MTRKAARKRREEFAKRSSQLVSKQAVRPQTSSAWIVGTFVASTAMAAFPAAAFARERALFDQSDATAQTPGTYTFAIPAGPFADVLMAFERVTGMTVTLTVDSISGVQSPGVSGVFTAEQALRAIVADTSVRYHLTSAASAILELSTQSETVEVTGSAPNVTVSSPKYTQPLRDTPQTLVVIPSSAMQAQGAFGLRDALRNTPGITMSAGEGGTAPGDNFLIRGFSARNDVYIDGARDPGVAIRDTFNVEAVEVTKGPSSVTGGRGSTGGSVNLVTKSAKLQDVGEIRLSGGNWDQKRTTFDVNHRVSDSVAVRLTGVWQDSGVPRRDDVENKSWGFAPSIGIGLGRPTSFTVGYQSLRQNNIPDYGLPGTLPDLAIAAGKTVKDIDFSNFYGLLSRDHEKVNSDVVTGTLGHRFASGATLRNLTRYGRNYLDRVVTPPRAASAANGAADPGYDPTVAQIRRTDTKYQYRDDRNVTNQTDLTKNFATGSIQHATVAGLEFAHDHQPSYAATDLFTNGRPPVTDLYNPDPTQPYTAAIAPSGATSEGNANSAGAYVFDNIKLSEKLDVDLGIRYDHINVEYDTATVPSVAAHFGRTDQAASGRAGIVYKPAVRGLIYAAYSTSFNPSFDGAFGLTLGATGVNNSALPPERTRNFEVGTKWDVTPRLFATFAAFRTEKLNAKTTDATTGATVLAGDQQVTGVEFSVSGNVTERWAVFSGLSLMDGKIKDSLVAAEVDRQLSYVPQQSFNVWSTYRLPLNISVGGGAQFTGGYYLNNTNALASANAAAIQQLTKYWLFNAMASGRLTPHVDLQLNMNNLANERYVDRGLTGHFIPGTGRSIIVGPVITF